MKLSRFPRIRITHGPTALEPLKRLSEALGGPNLWIKRDDCTGLASGGNKTRKLEYLMAQAVQQGADTVITQGATQSNHARQTVAISAKLGMQSHIIPEDRTGYKFDDYKHSGNVFLDHLYGASVTEAPKDTDMNAAMATLAQELRAKGRKPYIIPGGGSNPVGALGYVTCALELMDQANNMGVAFDALVHATGSAGTQAGVVVGLYGARSQIPILGIGVRAAKQAQEERVFALAKETAELLGVPGSTCAARATSDAVRTSCSCTPAARWRCTATCTPSRTPWRHDDKRGNAARAERAVFADRPCGAAAWPSPPHWPGPARPSCCAAGARRRCASARW